MKLSAVLIILWLILISPTLTLAQTTTLTPSNSGEIARRDFTLDLGGGVKTAAELVYPTQGNKPFPAVLFLGGSGAADMNGATQETPQVKPYQEMTDNLARRGFVVLKYNKRGIGANGFITNQRVSDGRTNAVLVSDGLVALQALRSDPLADPNRIYILGHSQGTLVAAQIVQQAKGTVKGLVLAGPIADWKLAFDYQLVDEYLTAASQIDTNHDGLLTPDELTASLNSNPNVYANANRNRLFSLGYFQTTNTLGQVPRVSCQSIIDLNGDCQFSIEQELKPALQKTRQNLLTNTQILRSSKESAAAIQSALDGPTLGQILPTLGLPTLFQYGSDDERAPLSPVQAVEKQLSQAGIATDLKTYPALTHVFIPDDIALAISLKKSIPAQVIPANVLDDQANWFNRLVTLPQGGQTATVSPAAGSITPVATPTTMMQPDHLPAAGFGVVSKQDDSWLVLLILTSGAGGSTFLLIWRKHRRRACKN